MLLRELFSNVRKPILKEGGGNIWPETVEFYPTPDTVQALLSQVKKYLRKAGFPLYVQGSGANTDPTPEHPTGDLDVSCDMDQVKQYFKIQKINFAAIGNVVSQLHLHIVGRQTTDCIWPQPVWGHLHQSKAYDAKEVSDISVALKSFMAHSVKG